MRSVASVVSDSVTLWIVAHQAPPGKNTGVGSYFLLQGIFGIQESNACLLHWLADSLPLRHREAPSFTTLICKDSVIRIPHHGTVVIMIQVHLYKMLGTVSDSVHRVFITR